MVDSATIGGYGNRKRVGVGIFSSRILSITAFGIAACMAVAMAVAAGRPAHEGDPPNEQVSPSGDALHTVFWPHPRPLPEPARAVADIAASKATFLPVDVPPDGDFPVNIQYLPDGSEVAVVHRDSGDVTFFDVALATPTGRVKVGDTPLDLAVAATGDWAVVPNLGDHTVSVIDLSTRDVAAQVPVGGQQPYRVAIDAAGSVAVVGLINDAVSSAFSVIDLASQSEIRTIPSAPQGANGFRSDEKTGRLQQYFTQFALTPDGTTIIQPFTADARVLFYDRATGTELADLPVPPSPRAVDVSDDGALAVIAGRDAVTVIDVAKRAVLDSFGVSANGQRRIVRITPDKGHAVTIDNGSTLFINLATGEIDARIYDEIFDIGFSFDGVYAILSTFEVQIVELGVFQLARVFDESFNDQLAVSPVEHRAVTHSLLGRNEELVIYDTTGVIGSVVARLPSGPPPEGDSPTHLAMTADGQRLLASNLLSSNVAVIDLASRKVSSIDAGLHVDAVAVTADGRFAVTANREENTASVLDLEAGAEVAVLPVPIRPFQVLVAPDGRFAYVTTLSYTNQLYFIDLDGADSQVAGSLATGRMGSTSFLPYRETSGMSLSPDGSILALCISQEDELLLVDTASRSELARVPVGDYPLRVDFTPGGELAFVTNTFDNSVSVVGVDGAASTVVATIPDIAFPFAVEAGAGDFVYVGSYARQEPAVHVVDVASASVVATVALPGPVRAMQLSASESLLLATSTTSEGGTLTLLDAAGAATVVTETIDLTGTSLDLAYSPQLRTAAASLPYLDGVDLVALAPGLIFADGFESGDTLSWSSTTTP